MASPVVFDVEQVYTRDANVALFSHHRKRTFTKTFGKHRPVPREERQLSRPNIAVASPDPRSAILDIFNPDEAEARSCNEGTVKRRKLNTGDSATFESLGHFDESKSISLSKASIELRQRFSDVSVRNYSSSLTYTNLQPIVVALERFGILSENRIEFTLWNANEPTTGVDFVATFPESETGVIRLLEAVSNELNITLDGAKRGAKLGTCFSRCILYPLDEGPSLFRLEADIRWLVDIAVAETMTMSNSRGKKDWKFLEEFCFENASRAEISLSLSDFYDSVYVPPNDLSVSTRIKEGPLTTPLYPFQQRAVHWLLQREGVEYTATGNLQPFVESETIPISFTAKKDTSGQTYYVSKARGLIVTNLQAVSDGSRNIHGGILAEEMGLGKTVEMISLISHHKRQLPNGSVVDPYTGSDVRPSGSTLIITPPSILEQWKNEIKKHAPELKVLHYRGLPPASAKEKEHEQTTVDYLMGHDVVLTTYTVLSREVHFATPPPNRSFRHGKKHEPRRSPLVQISWWRVCLDEAQMIESGVGQAAIVARLIPRCNAWAVSGTPLAKGINDLRGLLMFLRCEPFASHKVAWDRLDLESFQNLFGKLSLRHSKDRIRDELRLPPQKRVVITVPFTAIEEQNYSSMIRQMCEACGLTPEGIPIEEGRDSSHPEVVDRMRDWLVRLRQTCLHAHVGRRNRRALGAKNGPLRTVHEVLEVMIEQNDNLLKAEAREYILAHIKCGHVKGNAKNVEKRSENALEFYRQALDEAKSYVSACRDDLAMEKAKMGQTEQENDQEMEDDDEEGRTMGRIPTIRKSLRAFLELEHACDFFTGTAYFQIKSNPKLTEPDSEAFQRLEKLEMEWYDKAKDVRKELLRIPQQRAQNHMDRIGLQNSFHQIEEVKEIDDFGGIENKKVLNMMDDLGQLLNANRSQLMKWRQKVVEILLLPLVDEDAGKDNTGEEYEDSTKVQDELYVYTMALRTLIADRCALVSGLKDLLTEHELKTAEGLARDPTGPKGHAPELVLEVVKIRQSLQPVQDVGSLKGALSGARSLITALQWRADGGDSRAATELKIAQKQLAEIQSILNDQTKVLTELEKEQDMFRVAMNQRLEFYRQLQRISDTVAPYKDELDASFDQRTFDRLLVRKTELYTQLNRYRTKHKYLTNLRKENEDADVNHECIICQDAFEIGVLTSCGHKYCKECINLWWHSHRTCPLCKMRLYTRDFKDINFKPSMTAQEEAHIDGDPSQGSSPSSASTSIYSDISASMMKEIKTIDLDGSYGTKVDMIARHLLWIRNNDPGAKTIIFSQFGDFLNVLREALQRWRIGSSSIRDKDGIDTFLADPAVECFLLDAKSDSSGLNLVNATYVFLCEPLINPAIELQAIARVHRIGQQRPTTVFMYLVSDTVEEAIYDISVARRLEHIGRSLQSSGSTTPALQEKTIEAANSMELESTAVKQLLRKKGDGEVVKAGDLWKCLFGKPRKPMKSVLEQEVGRHLRAEAAEQRATAI
ncbi:ATP-dependent DNA helicase [Dendryphion nanum]|uniref:ATP-dependent DNA helicase n=1 Tax=Dendryphion nanum TaxID=256645 RepID=A0A9P9E490_9PLEO|nr:ATP-dependent DNA helicase [Dendryphion nanum]